eukprot:11217710-Ditylum_brightwellii.AAC.1
MIRRPPAGHALHGHSKVDAPSVDRMLTENSQELVDSLTYEQQNEKSFGMHKLRLSSMLPERIP